MEYCSVFTHTQIQSTWSMYFWVSPDWWQSLRRVGCCCALPPHLTGTHALHDLTKCWQIAEERSRVTGERSSAVRSLTAWRKLRTSAKDVLTAQGERCTILHHRGEDTLRSYGDGTTLVPRLSYAAYACVELVPRSPHALTAFHTIWLRS